MSDGGRPLVSACLIGRRCRYHGGCETRDSLRSRYEAGELVAACPEELGGLGTPREPAEIFWRAGCESERAPDGRDVLLGRARVLGVESGIDVTAGYVAGALETARLAVAEGSRRAYLKARSPSCGSVRIAHRGATAPGRGVAAALLVALGIEVLEVE